MKKYTLFITSLLLLAMHCQSIAKTPPPNIILVIADDLSWDDIGAYGHPSIHTPHLDAMAENGMRFDSAYLTASSCSPSRASIITGRYPHNTDAEQLHWDLPLTQTTFPEVLRESGYWTAAAGKWHLGEAIKDRFDLVKEAKYGEGSLSGSGEWLDLLDDRPKDKPFFLWLAAWDAHRPFFQESHPYEHKQSDVRLPPYYPPTELYMDDFVAYYNEIGRFDNNVGNIVKKLEKQGIADNTLIIVIADNGRPYARDKTTLFDSGVKTPFIAYWPKGINKGSVSDSIISSIDISATFLDVAGIKKPSTIEGKSFSALFKAPQKTFREYAVSERNWHDFEDHGRSIRSKRFRYIKNNYNDLPPTPSADTVYHKTWWELGRLYDAGLLNKHQSRPFILPRAKIEFYDLEKDPFELNNLADYGEYKDEIAKHKMALEQWEKETNDFIPSVRTLDDFDRRTGAYAPHRKRPRPSKMEIYGKSGAY